MARRLVDLTTLKVYLGIPLVLCTYDLALVSVLDRVGRIVEEYLGEPVLESEREHFFQGDGTPVLRLPYRAVVRVEQVIKLGGICGEDVELDPACYLVQRYSGGYRLVRADRWDPCAEYMVRLILGRQSVPEPIQEAALRLASDIVAKSRIAGLGKGRLGITRQGETLPGTEPAEDGTYAIASVTPVDITPEVAGLLASYRVITMPF